MSSDQAAQTRRSFHDKWQNNARLAFDETLREGSDIFNWILTRNGFDSNAALRAFLSSKTRILDAGCGSGRVTALLRKYSPPDTHVVGIDLVAADIAQQNLSGADNVECLPKDLLEDLSDLGEFDFIYCQEVLHHTLQPQQAFRNLANLLTDGGEIAIYVYKKKALVREFVDDAIRGRMSELPYESAMHVARQLTELGRVLSECDAEVDVPAVDVLDIPAGRHSVQRFLYHFFVKCFWNPELSFEDNAAINYDWYHPQICSRHTIEEVRDWFADCGLSIQHEYVDMYGITVRGSRSGATGS